jgi:hypothetical protein
VDLVTARWHVIEAGARALGTGDPNHDWTLAAAVIDAVEPIIRAEAIAEVREKHRAEMRALRAQVEALPTLPLGGWDVVFRKDVLALLGGTP